MIHVYVYCSFGDSSVGFQLGTFQYNSTRSEPYELGKGNISRFIAKLFGIGDITGSYGKNPEEETFFFLKKNLKGSGKYVNFAFETDKQEEFLLLKGGLDTLSDEQLLSAWADSIIKAPGNEFGLKIDAGKINAFIKQLLEGGKKFTGDAERTYFVASAKADLERLKKKLGYDVMKVSPGLYVISNSTEKVVHDTLEKLKPLGTVVLIAVFVGLAVLLLSMGINKKTLMEKIDGLTEDKKKISLELENCQRKLGELQDENRILKESLSLEGTWASEDSGSSVRLVIHGCSYELYGQTNYAIVGDVDKEGVLKARGQLHDVDQLAKEQDTKKSKLQDALNRKFEYSDGCIELFVDDNKSIKLYKQQE